MVPIFHVAAECPVADHDAILRARKHFTREESARARVCRNENLSKNGNEQRQRDRTPGLKALFNMLATTNSDGQELVKQGRSNRNGMVTFGRAHESFGKNCRCSEAPRCVSVPEDFQ